MGTLKVMGVSKLMRVSKVMRTYDVLYDLLHHKLQILALIDANPLEF